MERIWCKAAHQPLYTHQVNTYPHVDFYVPIDLLIQA